MIIKRMSEGIRNQDWFVVGVEIMIVVVGIFVGLQVDDWNEARKDRATAVEMIDQLKDDIDSAVSSAENSIKGHLGRVEDGVIALRFLKNEIAYADNEDAILRAFQYTHRREVAQIKRGNLALVLEGRLYHLFENGEVQRQLRDLVIEMNTDMQRYEHVLGRLDVEVSYQREKVAMSLTEPGIPPLFDLEAIKQDQAFAISLQNTVQRHLAASHNLNAMISYLNAMKELLQ